MSRRGQQADAPGPGGSVHRCHHRSGAVGDQPQDARQLPHPRSTRPGLGRFFQVHSGAEHRPAVGQDDHPDGRVGARPVQGSGEFPAYRRRQGVAVAGGVKGDGCHPAIDLQRHDGVGHQSSRSPFGESVDENQGVPNGAAEWLSVCTAITSPALAYLHTAF